MSDTGQQVISKTNYSKNLVEDCWSKNDCSATDKHFYRFPAIRSRSCKLIFNESDATRTDWVEFWTIEKYLKNSIPFEKCLSICCGFGETERNLSKLKAANKIIGMDIATNAIDQARKRAKAERLDNIEYCISDLNTVDLPEQEYDLIWANGALHHIKELDNVLHKLTRALKSGGYLIANEYIGPKYQQLGKRQIEIINAAKHLLPPELRENPQFNQQGILEKPAFGNSFLIKALYWVIRHVQRNDQSYVPNPYAQIYQLTPIQYFLETDPSECISSDKILSLLKKHYNLVDVRNYNGSILCYALDTAFYNNYDINNSQHQKILELLFHIEDALIANGELQSDNAHIICRKL